MFVRVANARVRPCAHCFPQILDLNVIRGENHDHNDR